MRVMLVLVMACGSGRSADSTLVIDDPKPATNATPETPAATGSKPASKTPAITANLTISEACARFEKLAQAGCDWTARFPPAFRQASNCEGSLETWAKDPKLQKMIQCWSQECEPAAQCMASQAEGENKPARKCGEDGTGPVIADAAQWATRPGANAKKFAEVTSSEKAPVEVCGIQQELEWITSVKCNDGSNPYGSLEKANDSRDGYVQKGGRCNSILDRYSVKCPEKTYTVFIDRYVCPEKR